MKITRNELIEKIREIKGTTFINLTYKTDESKSRTVKGKKALQKEVTLNVTLNANYEAKVNRIIENKQDGEADFEAQEMKGKKLSFADCRSIVESVKSGSKMLYCFREHNAKSQTTYFFEGCVIPFEKAKERDLFAPSFFAEKKTVGRGEVEAENDFSVFTVGIDKIKRITMKGTEYFIED